MNGYEKHTKITKELLDGIKVGDLIKVNDWGKPLRVKGVSKDYFVMATKQFGNVVYSVCEKRPRDSGYHNRMTPGKFHVSTDHWIFGCMTWLDFNDTGEYDFENQLGTAAYLATFELSEDEPGKSKLSERSGIAIETLHIKRQIN